eukprot:6011604-Amphidinium_carterae.1
MSGANFALFARCRLSCSSDMHVRTLLLVCVCKLLLKATAEPRQATLTSNTTDEKMPIMVLTSTMALLIATCRILLDLA